MAQTASIPPKLHNEIINLLSEGLSAVKITSILNEKYNTNYQYDAVNRLITKLRKEYQEIAKAKLVQGIEASATTDLHILDTVISGLFSKYQQLMADDSVDQALKVAAELNKWNSRRIELSGINRTDATVVDHLEAREEIIEQLNKITSKHN